MPPSTQRPPKKPTSRMYRTLGLGRKKSSLPNGHARERRQFRSPWITIGDKRVSSMKSKFSQPEGPNSKRAKVRTEVDWEELIRSRWDPSTKTLDLEKICDAEEDLPDNFPRLEQQAGLVFQQISHMLQKVKTLNLSDNLISPSTLAELARYLPDVVNLSLRKMNIHRWSDLDPISYGSLNLRDLVILETPLVNAAADTGSFNDYIREMVRRFPYLQILDTVLLGEPLMGEVWEGFERDDPEQGEFSTGSQVKPDMDENMEWSGFSDLPHVEEKDADMWDGFSTDEMEFQSGSATYETWSGFGSVPSNNAEDWAGFDPEASMDTDNEPDFPPKEAKPHNYSKDKRLDAAMEDLIGSSSDAPATRHNMALLLQAMLDRQNRPADYTPVDQVYPTPNPSPCKPPRSRRSPEKVELQADIRAYATILMKVHKVNLETGEVDPVEYASLQEVARFSRSRKARDGPTAANFKIDLGSCASSWNKRAVTVFAESFIDSNRYNCTDMAEVKKAFSTHLKTLRLRAQEAMEDDLDTSQDKLDQQILESRTARRLYILERRQGVCGKFKSIDHRIREVIRDLKTDAMSGDETTMPGDDGRPRYAITNLKWRNPAIHSWFKTLDRLHLSTRFTSNLRATRGAFPHIRLPSSRLETHDPVQLGLPANFYNPSYLDELDDYERDALNIQPSLDLTLPPNLMRLAARFARVVNHKTPPLAENDPSLSSYPSESNSSQ